MDPVEVRADILKAGEGDRECRVGALIAYVRHRFGRYVSKPALACHLGRAFPGHGVEVTCESLAIHIQQRLLDRFLPTCFDEGETHSECGQEPGIGMDHDGPDPKGCSHLAGQLRSGASETLKRVKADIGAFGDGDLLDRLRHVGNGDVEEAFGRVFGGLADCLGQDVEFLPYHQAVERLICVRAKHAWKVPGLDASDQYVCIRYCQRSAAPVTRRTGIGAGAFRSYPHACILEEKNRSSTCGYRMNGQHWHAKAHSFVFCFEAATVGAVEAGNVCGGPAHVETNYAAEAGAAGCFGHAYDATCRSGEQGVLAGKV